MINIFLKQVFLNKSSRLLLAVNLFLWGYVLWERGGIKQADFHFYYESLLMQILLVVNFPSLLITGLLIIPTAFLLSASEPNTANIWLQLFLFILCSSVQWGVVGYWIDKLRHKILS